MITIKRTNSDDADFQSLVRLLDADLKIRDGDQHSFFSQFNKIDGLRNVVVCYDSNKLIGCGAFKEFDKATVEIKRMFVHPAFRGKGNATIILKELELWAVEMSYSAFILETGKRQPEAIRLYKKTGYTIIPNYGQYENIETSVCFKKIIQNSSANK